MECGQLLFLLKEADAAEQLKIILNTKDVSKYKQILRNECTGKENLFVMLSFYKAKPFLLYFVYTEIWVLCR